MHYKYLRTLSDVIPIFDASFRKSSRSIVGFVERTAKNTTKYRVYIFAGNLASNHALFPLIGREHAATRLCRHVYALLLFNIYQDNVKTHLKMNLNRIK